MQSSSIVHRDLKPENIMLQVNADTKIIEGIKIIDFGLSKVMLSDELLFEKCGTPSFVAPEVLTYQGYDSKVDIWSAGCILGELLLNFIELNQEI